MQNIVQIKEVLDSLGSVVSEYRKCRGPDSAEISRQKLGNVRRHLLESLNPAVSERFSQLDPVLFSLLNEHLSSLVLSIGDLQEVHDTKVRAQHIDADTFHNLLLTHIHPIIRQIDERLLAMHAALQGLSVAARRNP